MKYRESKKRIRELEPYLENHKGFIAGGCFKDLFLKREFKDIDIFFKNVVDRRQAEEYFRDNSSYSLVYENKNAISFKNQNTGVRLELITCIGGTPEQVLDLFDFSITKFALEKTEDGYRNLFISSFFQDLVEGQLVIDELAAPRSTLSRSYRYRDYGFKLDKVNQDRLIEALKNTQESGDSYFEEREER